MRSTAGTQIDTAVAATAGIYPLIYAEIEPSRAWTDTWDWEQAWGTADTSGMPDSPVPQTLGYSATSHEPVSFFKNGSGDLCYQVKGFSPVTTVYSVTHGPSIADNSYIYYETSGTVTRGTISWSAIATQSTNPFSGTTSFGSFSNIRNVVALNASYCAAIQESEGGFYIIICSSGTDYTSFDRVMFPTSFNYGTARTMDQLAAWSAGIALGTQMNVYMSDPYTGCVIGITFDTDTLLFGDIFTAVPCQLQVSLCEFRCIQGYTHQNVGYLVGQFRRTDNVESALVYTFIMPTTDGHNFAMDRFPFVSDMSRPIRAAVGETYLALGNSGGFSTLPLTYFFNGTATSNHTKVTVPGTAIKSFSDQNLERASLSLKSGDEVYLWDTDIKEESRCTIYLGLKTTAGNEYLKYGTYIIDSIRRGIADGKRTMDMELVNLTEWKLTGLSSPFYTEYFSKSSEHATLDEECGKLYVAPEIKMAKNSFVVDFWGAEGLDHTPYTGISLEDRGGVGSVEIAGDHSGGRSVQSKDLKDILGCAEYPTVTGTSVTMDLWGWSHDNRVDTTTKDATSENDGTNDSIKGFLLIKHADGSEDLYESGTGNWPATWPADHTHAGNLPLEVTVSSLTAGDEIMRVGVIFSADHATHSNIARIEIRSGIEYLTGYTDANTPWEATKTDGWKLPGKYRHHVMFAQKPYNAWNFRVKAQFKITATGGAAGYSQACGLVGHGWDGQNYIVGRWNVKANLMEIGIARKGVITVLASAAPPLTPGELVTLYFCHQNGRYSLWILNTSNNLWTHCVSYSWLAADGWMFNSKTATLKCGIYGIINAPNFKIVGLDISSSPDVTTACAIPYLPGQYITDFPASGKCDIGDNVYQYTSKVTCTLDEIRGPYQFRQNAAYDVSGVTKNGLECRDMDWGASTLLNNGKIIALSNGMNFNATETRWQTTHTTGGVTIYDHGRARYYSSDEVIARISGGLTTKVYITGGLILDIDQPLVSGKYQRHTAGTLCAVHTEGNIWCRWFAGSSGDPDATTEDLIEKVVKSSGGTCQFPSDVTISSQVISGDYTVGTVNYTEGFDLRWTTTSETCGVKASVALKNVVMGDTDTGIYMTLADQGGGNVLLSLTSTPSNSTVEQITLSGSTATHKYRLLAHDNFLTLYKDDKWAFSFHFKEVTYAVANAVKLSGSFTATSIRLQEIPDWREAVYIDLETDGRSAISNIIQERPIESYCRSDGSYAFWYEPPASGSLSLTYKPIRHTWGSSMPREGASDAIVYNAKQAQTLQHHAYGQEYGFSTKVFRMPNLNVGAIKAAKILLNRLYLSSTKHEMFSRIDPRIEPGDKLTVSYTTSGTGQVVSPSFIAESISLQLTASAKSLSASGRYAE